MNSLLTINKKQNFSNLLHKELENLDDQGYTKTTDPVEPNADEGFWNCSSYLLRHKTTLHCAEGKAKKLGNWAMQQMKL